MNKRISTYLIFFLVSIVVVVSVYNLIQFFSIRSSRELTFRQFINKNTDQKLFTPCNNNIFFLVSPLDCKSCTEPFLSIDFINKLKEIGIKKGEPFCINYVVSGDYSEKEKRDYISEIESEINVYIDKNNIAKTFLLRKYDTIRTPFLIILTKKGETKYWQDFDPHERYGYQFMDTKLLNLLEEIL